MTTTAPPPVEREPCVASDSESWATLQGRFKDAPIDEPIKLADGWDPDMVDDPAHLVEHLRVSIRGLLVDGSLTGHAFLFCERDPISQAEQRCIYRVRIRAGEHDVDSVDLIAKTFGVVVRSICHYGQARAVAFLSPGTIAHAVERRMLNCCVASIVHRDQPMRTFISNAVDRRKLDSDWLPTFKAAPDHLHLLDLYAAKHVLAGLPRLDLLITAVQRSGLALWDVLALEDERDRVRVMVMVETQRIVHLAELPPRHRAQTLVVDRDNRETIVSESQPWRLELAHAVNAAQSIADAFDALGVLPTKFER